MKKAKIRNPIHIYLNDNRYFELETFKQYIVSSNHYGFFLQMIGGEFAIYPTESEIQKIQVDDGYLKIFEQEKKHPWLFDSKGRLISIATFEPDYLNKTLIKRMKLD